MRKGLTFQISHLFCSPAQRNVTQDDINILISKIIKLFIGQIPWGQVLKHSI